MGDYIVQASKMSVVCYYTFLFLTQGALELFQTTTDLLQSV